ncbi:hypothetical protein Sarmat_00958 [Rickettsiales endosymbiont of Paramecium tredecaurelia]|uniref:hypothetical protein n=1 Tax=Candidatus Sarmatiella mevalonica TaxID=2770581 RepID=UPI001920AE43|nr:hypothetical protein [Candidatus Sarmatiella mevalonica]MBL3285092.1 hypothetical protein [Candidatus Sarmatiella mevalonica]
MEKARSLEVILPIARAFHAADQCLYEGSGWPEPKGEAEPEYYLEKTLTYSTLSTIENFTNLISEGHILNDHNGRTFTTVLKSLAFYYLGVPPLMIETGFLDKESKAGITALLVLGMERMQKQIDSGKYFDLAIIDPDKEDLEWPTKKDLIDILKKSAHMMISKAHLKR